MHDVAATIIAKAIPPVCATLFVAEETGLLAGNSGWMGAGLLGAVLAWLLLKHLPEKDRQAADMGAKFDTARREFLDALKSERLTIKEIGDAHAGAITRVTEHCNDESIENRKAALLLAEEGRKAAALLSEENRRASALLSSENRKAATMLAEESRRAAKELADTLITTNNRQFAILRANAGIPDDPPAIRGAK